VTELIVTRRARKLLDGLPEPLRVAALATIESLILDPWALGKPLTGRLRGGWVARVGNYRVFYTIEEGPGWSRVIVRSVRHRAVAYRRRRP
jgi:mRNA-degrading endonuclease RelE of RelBE toxin-antitoxin system